MQHVQINTNLSPPIPPVDVLSSEDLISLETLARVLGLWFQDLTWERLQNDEGVGYVYLRDPPGNLSLILAPDETGEFATENFGDHKVPAASGPSIAALALDLAHHYANRWTMMGLAAAAILKDSLAVVW